MRVTGSIVTRLDGLLTSETLVGPKLAGTCVFTRQNREAAGNDDVAENLDREHADGDHQTRAPTRVGPAGIGVDAGVVAVQERRMKDATEHDRGAGHEQPAGLRRWSSRPADERRKARKQKSRPRRQCEPD